MVKFCLALLLTVPALQRSFIYEDPEVDRAVRHAMNATYNLELVEARKTARSLQRSLPDHPVGYLLDAETYWWEAQTDPTRKEIEDEYFKVQQKTVEIGEKALKSTKYPEIEIRAYLGSAWGSKARFRLTQHGVGWSTVRDGMKAHGYAEEVYKAAPDYTDILVGIGSYNYFTGKVPSVLKPFMLLFGARGNPTLGLQQIRTVIDKGRYAQTEARIVLFTVLMKDEQYDKSFEVLQKLIADYPANYAFYPWITQWYDDQKKHAAGVEYLEKFALQKQASSVKLAQHALYEKAVLQNLLRRPADSRATLARLKGMAAPDPALARTIVAFEKKLKG
jgi:hypothetical protein